MGWLWGGTASRSRGVAIGTACALVLVLLAPDEPAGAQEPAASALSIHDPMPVPGDVVPAGAITVGAVVRGPNEVTWAEVRVAGTAVPHRATRDGEAVVLEADAHLDVGHHRIEVVVRDTTGAEARRGWWVAASDLRIKRLAGTDRVETAVAVSQRHRPDAAVARGAVLTRMDDFPDALGGAALAAHLDGPLLLSAREALSPATARELRRALVPGAPVHLLGGPAALSVAVEQQVRALGFPVLRHAGADRFATAVRVAEQLPPGPAAMLASGWHFPDALAASVPAARDGMPVLLTDRDVLPATVHDFLARRGMTTVHVVGGANAVGDPVVAHVETLVGEVHRVAGDTRHATAMAVAETFFSAPADVVVITSGDRFPDALAGAPFAASLDTPLLLSPPDGLVPAQAHRLIAHPPSRAVVLGGTTALGRVVEGDLRRAHASSADGPREVAAQPPAGSRVAELPDVTLHFDRALDGPGHSSIHVTVDGREVPGRVEVAGAALTLRVAGTPPTVGPDGNHVVRVVVAVRAGGAWRHLEHTFTLHGPTRSPPGLVHTLLDDGASGVALGERVVSLTFDDGPSLTWTPQVLDVLDRYGVAATFFVTGSSTASYPALARDIVARGHTVANHGWSHRSLRGLDEATFAWEVDRTTAEIATTTGQAVHCLRPPYGSHDGTVVSRAAARGLHTAMWTVDTRDWTRPGSEAISRAVLADLRPGAVYLFHDGGGDRSQTVAALPTIIEGVRNAGYGFALLCQ